MSILAYSELHKRILGIDEQELEKPFVILSRNNTTKNRLLILKELAKLEPISIGALLKRMHLPRGGGSYISIKKYFKNLEKEKLLGCEKKKNVDIWFFDSNNKLFKKFILG